MKRNYRKPEVVLFGLEDIMDVITPGSETNVFDAKKNDIEFDWDDEEPMFKDFRADDDLGKKKSVWDE